MRIRIVPLVCALLAAPLFANAQDAVAPVQPVVQLGFNVLPYYQAGAKLGAPPRVAVDPDYDALLSSTRPEDIFKVRTAIAADPGLVKPQTLIVLAARLYDIGARDDAVFWYYAGRDRFLTMEAVLDMRSLILIPSGEVVDSFVRTVGPDFESYAYCSIANQVEQRDRAIAWVAAHPYKLLGYTRLPALVEDRNAALAAAVNAMRENAARDKQSLKDPATLAAIEAARAKVHAHERYCWR